MAEEQSDKEQRTENATGKRIYEARREGKLPVSQEVRTWFMLVAGLIVMAYVAPLLGREMLESLAVYFSMADQLNAADGSAMNALMETFHHMMPGMAVAIAILIIAALLGTISQTGFFAETSLIKIDFNRLSLIAGWRRLLSPQSIVEMFKSIIKISFVMILMYRLLKPLVMDAEWFVGMQAALQTEIMYKTIIKLMGIAVMFISVYAAIDWIYQKRRYDESLKMTKQEVKDENKQSEGDPIARNRLRRLRVERARQRMMAKVPDADVVITNPTHFAVALVYNAAKMRAPRVVAKGQDLIAMKIREIAQENEVPLVENPPLARALYASCEIDEEVPVEQYQAVAEVISYVYKLKKKTVKR